MGVTGFGSGSSHPEVPGWEPTPPPPPPAPAPAPEPDPTPPAPEPDPSDDPPEVKSAKKTSKKKSES